MTSLPKQGNNILINNKEENTMSKTSIGLDKKASEKLAVELETVAFKPFEKPLISNTTAQVMAFDDIKALLMEKLRTRNWKMQPERQSRQMAVFSSALTGMTGSSVRQPSAM